MTISSLYSDYYLPWCIQQNIEPVLEHTYRKIFCSEYNIGFKLPKSDTCKTCDQLNIKIEPERIVANDQELIRLQNELRLHNAKALAMQEKLKLETAVSKNNSRKLENNKYNRLCHFRN